MKAVKYVARDNGMMATGSQLVLLRWTLPNVRMATLTWRHRSLGGLPRPITRLLASVGAPST